MLHKNGNTTENCLKMTLRILSATFSSSLNDSSAAVGTNPAHQFASASQQGDPERGGRCIHRPQPDGESGETDEFLIYARNIIMQTPEWTSPVALASVDRRWKEELESKFGGPVFRRGSSNNSVGSGRRRGRKRKPIPEDDEETWGNMASSSEKEDEELSKIAVVKQLVTPLAFSATAEETKSKSGLSVFSSLEEDERMLEFLSSKHWGNRDRAKISMISDLSMGRGETSWMDALTAVVTSLVEFGLIILLIYFMTLFATSLIAVQARRYFRKRRKLEEIDSPLSDMFYPSESWRRRYERLCCTMLGDVCTRPGSNQYPYHFGARLGGVAYASLSEKPCKEGSPKNPFSGHLVCVEDSKQLWRSLLDCAEDIVERATGLAPSKPKPRLRDLLTLLGKAHTLLRPEEIFGKRDTTVKRISQSLNSIVDLVVKARNHLAKLIDILYDEKDEGIELDELHKSISVAERDSLVVIEETKTLLEIANEASLWEKRLNNVLRPDHSDSSSISESIDRNDILTAVEQIAQDGKLLSLLPRSLIALEKRIEGAHKLRDRIRQIKQVSSFFCWENVAVV